MYNVTNIHNKTEIFNEDSEIQSEIQSRSVRDSGFVVDPSGILCINNITGDFYLYIHNSMSWVSHITIIVHKVSRTLNIINLQLFKKVKETAYHTLVRPCLEYVSGIWDSYQLYVISDIWEMQRRATRWTLSDYNRYNSVSNILTHLQWSSITREATVSLMSLYVSQNLTWPIMLKLFKGTVLVIKT